MFLTNVFKEKKEEVGLTVSEISEKSGLKEHYIKKLLYNKIQNPEIEKLEKLATVLQCKPSELIYDGDVVLDDLMQECEDIIKKTTKENCLDLNDEQIIDWVKKAYDYAIIRKSKNKRPPLDKDFTNWFIIQNKQS
ncbi:MAG: helix-turn-helix transcriptional regulator [Proteobacteria bacterium]|nr:helix-turn-helix transcriptional regulator [Pseudomonadota bacterium]